MSVEPQARLDDRIEPRDPARSSREDVRPAGVGIQTSGWEEDDENESVSLVLDISPELDDAIDCMAKDLVISKADVFVLAMTLLQMTLDAKKRGKRVCLTDDDLNVETEITGFGRFDESDLADSLSE